MLKAPIAQVLSMAAQPHDLPCCTMEVANRVWSGRVRVLEETNNEATERKQSKARDARAAGAGAAGAAARAGKVGVTQREREREREGVRFLEHLPEAIVLAVARLLET
jgi:hypothetical protein